MTNLRGKVAERPVALVTGASSGFGWAIAELLTERRYVVFGTSRSEAASGPAGVKMLPLDVRSEKSVEACIASVTNETQRLDILINNAGVGLGGAVEETSLQEAQDHFETNFFGAVRMTQAVLPGLRQQKSGRIVFIGSLAGLMALPAMGFYSAGKFALEGLAEALRYEVKNFGIHVSIIEPGTFHTNLMNAMRRASNPLDIYSDMRSAALQVMEQSVREGPEAVLVARTVLKILETSSPRLRYRVGQDATWLPRLKAALPGRAFEAAIRRHFKLDQENPMPRAPAARKAPF
jgi:NAD(P)-dependent dehydrogenase (short-subunit alcohol dehydrogenase family)